MNQKDFTLYLNFVVYAIVGHMGHADLLWQQNSDGIRRAARKLLSRIPPKKLQGPFYRGIVLGEKGKTSLEPDLNRTFISFSADIRVAKHFGDPLPNRGFGFGMEISDQYAPPFVDKKRGYFGDGYLVQYQPSKEEVLFHYSLLSEPVLVPIFENLFAQIGSNSSGSSQLKTFTGQKEVILINEGQVFDLKPLEVDPEYLAYAEKKRKEREEFEAQVIVVFK